MIALSKDTNIERIVAQKFEITARTQLKDWPGAYQNAKVKTFIDPVANQLAVQLKTWLLATEHSQEPARYSFPKTWWQMFKLDVFPAFLRKWFPVQWSYNVAVPNLDVRVCPHSDLKFRDSRHLSFISEPGRQGYWPENGDGQPQ